MERAFRAAPLTLIGDDEVHGYQPRMLRAALKRAGWIGPDDSAAAPAAAVVDLRLKAPLAEAVAVTNFLGDGLSFFHRGGGYLGASLATSTVPVPGRPISVEACLQTGTLTTVNHEAGTVTFLSLEDASYLNGTLEASTRPTGDFPLHAVAHPTEPLLYVSNSESRDLTVFNSASGDYAFGSFERSRVALPGMPGVMAIHPEEDILYVRLRSGAVTMLRARTLAPYRGDLEGSTFPTGAGRSLALSADHEILYVPQSLGSEDGLALYDACTGRPLMGSAEASLQPTAPVPFAVAAHPKRPIVYVSCFGPRVIEYRDGKTGEYLFSSAERSSFLAGPGARALLVDSTSETLFVTSFDDATVTLYDALTGAYRFGSREASTWSTDRGPRGMALLAR